MTIVSDPHVRAVEATLFASDQPMTVEQIRGYVGDEVDIADALAQLEAHYAGRGIELVRRGKSWHFQTAAHLAYVLRREREESRKLSRAAVETLAIIAYHQPVTRPEIEEIRGATLSQATLDALLDMALITSRGKKEVPGRPTLWGTTPRFLEQFGLKSLADLPRREDLVSNDAALPLIPASAPEQGE